MPSAIITLPDGRRARINGPSREAVLAQAQQLAAMPVPADPSAVADPGMALADAELASMRMDRGPSTERPASEARAPITLPFGLGEFTVGGRAARAVRAASSVPEETSVPIAMATLGSVATGPVMTAAAARQLAGPALAKLPAVARWAAGVPVRFGVRAAAPTAGAAAGGAVAGGALEAENPEATPGSIAGRAVETGLEMGTAELAGLGLTNVAGTLAAPAATFTKLRVLDPLREGRQALASFVKRLPAEARIAARRVEELLPEGAATTAREAVESVQGIVSQASNIFRRLVTSDGGQVPLAAAARTAERVARVLGSEHAARLGFDAANPGSFVTRVFAEADRATLGRLRERLGTRTFDNFLALNLSDLLERATVTAGGRRTLDGERLLAEWSRLPDAARRAYPAFTRQAVENLGTFGNAVRQVAQFAASPVGGEVLEAAATPAAFAIGGPALGVPLMVAKALLNPGPLVRYLTREELPSELAQLVGGQAVKTDVRAGRAENLRGEGPVDDEQYERIVGQLIDDPGYFGPEAANRLELAANRERPGALRSEIDDLMRSRRFRAKVEELGQ